MVHYKTSDILEELTDYDKIGTWKDIKEYLEASKSYTPMLIQPLCYDEEEGKIFVVKRLTL